MQTDVRWANEKGCIGFEALKTVYSHVPMRATCWMSMPTFFHQILYAFNNSTAQFWYFIISIIHIERQEKSRSTFHCSIDTLKRVITIIHVTSNDQQNMGYCVQYHAFLIIYVALRLLTLFLININLLKL